MSDEGDRATARNNGADAEENEWDSSAAGWDENEAVRVYARSAFESLQSLLESKGMTLDGACVVDFGCGTGLLAERMAASAAVVHAVDTSTAMLDVLRAKIERLGISNVHPSTQLPSAVGTQDIITCSSVCAFLSDYPRTVKNLVPLLRPGGIFVQWDWERVEDGPDDSGLSRDDIENALADAGLRDVSVDIGFEATVGASTMKPLMGTGRTEQASESA